jgi:hypothetical protein
MKYRVTGAFYASKTVKIDAESPDEAMESADLYASLCHLCAGEVELTDCSPFDISVSDENWSELIPFSHDEGEQRRERERILSLLRKADGRGSFAAAIRLIEGSVE